MSGLLSTRSSFSRSGGGIAAALLAACSLLASCSGPATSAEVRVEGVPPLNLNSHGESSTALLRIFKLKYPAKFDQATREELWKIEKAYAELEDSLVGKAIEREYTIGDGQIVIPVNQLEPEVKWLGLMLLCFNDREGEGKCKLSVPIEEVGSRTFRLQNYSIQKE